MNKDKLIPALRFPEFEDDEGWEEKKLNDICDITNGKANAQDHIDGSQYPLFDRSEIIKASNKYILDCEAVIIPGEGMRFIPKYYKGKFNLHQRAYALKGFSCNGQFVYHSMLHRSKLISQKAVQSTVLSLRLPTLQNFPIKIPHNPKEQQKIASCLSSLDELIAAHNEKLNALKDHKKGLMQNLFPNSLKHDYKRLNDDHDFEVNKKSSNQDNPKNQGSDNIPNYRFPEFENDGEWVEKQLGDAADFINGRAYKKEELLTSGKYRVLRVGNFFTNNEWYHSNLELVEDKYCDNGDLLYAWSASFGPRIWKEEKVIYHYHIWKVVEKKEIDKQFLFVLLDFETENIKATQARGLGMQHLTKSGIESWESTIPPTKKEQKKIAFCLLAVDELIIAQTEKIEGLQQHKKGLMQGLFPKIDS